MNSIAEAPLSRPVAAPAQGYLGTRYFVPLWLFGGWLAGRIGETMVPQGVRDRRFVHQSQSQGRRPEFRGGMTRTT
jgi:hypothetical protein